MTADGSLVKDGRAAGTPPGELVFGSASAGSVLHLSLPDVWVLLLVHLWLFVFKKFGQERKSPRFEIESLWPAARIGYGRFWSGLGSCSLFLCSSFVLLLCGDAPLKSCPVGHF